jgi:gluconolactonase
MNATSIFRCLSLLLLAAAHSVAVAQEPPAENKTKTVELLRVPAYCEGVVFDHAGNGYISWAKSITKFSLDGKHSVWAETGAPNGHKILADGTHLVCDASHHAVLHLSADGKMLEHAAKEFEGKPLLGPNDLTLDTANGGFYFSDPGDSSRENPIGRVHYVDKEGMVTLVDKGLAYPNGIVLTLDGKKLYVAESQHNRVFVYEVKGPGKVGERKLFADLPKHESGDHLQSQPDGMCLDAAGNLYVAHYGMKKVEVLSPDGKLIRQYDGGNVTTSNVAFGGPKHDQLFITGAIGNGVNEGGLFRIDLGVKGAAILPPAKD